MARFASSSSSVAVRVFAISAIVVVVVFDLFRTTVIVFRDLERASPQERAHTAGQVRRHTVPNGNERLGVRRPSLVQALAIANRTLPRRGSERMWSFCSWQPPCRMASRSSASLASPSSPPYCDSCTRSRRSGAPFKSVCKKTRVSRTVEAHESRHGESRPLFGKVLLVPAQL